jgi:hypothetical protein
MPRDKENHTKLNLEAIKSYNLQFLPLISFRDVIRKYALNGYIFKNRGLLSHFGDL